MLGSFRRERWASERAIETAWWVENFGRMGKKFRGLQHYLDRQAPQKAQTADDVIAIFEGFAGRGLVRIREVARP